MKSMNLITLLWIFYGFVISISIKKVIAVFAVKEERWRFSDPLYLILMVISVGVCIGAFKDYDFRLAFLISTGLIAIINFTLLRFTDSDYNPDKSARNAFKVAKKCPHCFSSLPSYFTSKCPHCTAEL